MGELNQKRIIMEELNALDYQTLSTAYLYAKNFRAYGVDVTKKWLTATQQSAALSRAYHDGYHDCVKQTEFVLIDAFVKDDKIKVGDEIVSRLGNKVIITSMGGQDGDWCCIDNKGCTCQLTEEIIKNYNWHKTGKHFPQIVEMLEQIEGE